MKRKHLFLLAVLSALLLSIPFYSWGSGIFILVGLVPMLFLEEEIARRKSGAGSQASGAGSQASGAKSQASGAKSQASGAGGESKRGRKSKGGRTDRVPRLGWYAALSFGLFVLLTTWWVYFASWIGIVASIIVTGSYMTLSFWLFHLIRRGLGDRLGYAAFGCFWLAFEFLYIRAQVNFPWLVLGYGFANDVALVQWYEWTGSLGGSLWALLTNLAVYFALKKWLAHRSEGRVKAFRATRGRLGWVVALVVIPMFVSILRYLTYAETGKPYEVVVLQPNIDPYEKFGTMDQAEQSRQLLRVADSLVTPKTDYIVGPETFLNQSVWQSTMHTHPEILKYYEFLAPFPRAKLVMGATTYRLYRDPSEYTPSSRPISNDKYRYDSFNSAFQLDSTGPIPLYHKSLLVAGVEHMPHKNILGFLEKLTLRLGGTFRSHGTQAFRDAFISPQDSTRVAPVICWESVFGEYVTGYVSGAGANFLFIITIAHRPAGKGDRPGGLVGEIRFEG